MTEDCVLVHHGVKGMKWGVRNGPPYPIEHPVMRKGTKLATVTGGATPGEARRSIKRKQGRALYTYNPNDNWDSKVYKGPFVRYLMSRGERYVAEHRLQTVRDLKMPNKAQRIQEFKDLYNDKKFHKRMIREMSNIQRMMVWQGVGTKESKSVDLRNLTSKADYDAAYEVFNSAMQWSHQFKSTKEYFNRMGNKYDAMVDDNNQGVYNDAHDPVIIFRINDVMYDYGSMPIRLLTAKEVSDNYKEVADELHKKGKTVLL